VTVSVNVSPLDVMHRDLAALVAARLAAHDLAVGSLMIELTESAALEAGASSLERLARLGIGVAVDDFGSGWSSLELLRRVPARRLKLDRSYVAMAAGDRTDEAIVAAAAALGHAFGMDVVAEGVETDEVMHAVGRLGCDLVQGFHVAPPMSAAELERWLAGRLPSPA
jgi:EAL domain-containing protein (putative c-di-GMP-specific phosphodiesterase class I)